MFFVFLRFLFFFIPLWKHANVGLWSTLIGHWHFWTKTNTQTDRRCKMWMWFAGNGRVYSHHQ